MSKNGLTAEQIRIGSIYLAMSNLGFDCSRIKDKETFNKTFQDFNNRWANELPDGGDEEFQDWKEALERGHDYSIETIKEELPWLFEEKV